MSLDNFFEQLRALSLPNCFNPWAQRSVDEIPLQQEGGLPHVYRVGRLRRHFDCKPKLLLIGEAPGHLGCRISGVPFTSERLLCEGTIPRIPACERITVHPRPLSEPSATIVWNCFAELGISRDVVMWNAFPIHPHLPGQPRTNRTPTTQEMQACQYLLHSLLCAFDGVPVVAIGNKAAGELEWLKDNQLLVSMGVCYKTVRHPARGGATLFRDGLRKIVEELK